MHLNGIPGDGGVQGGVEFQPVEVVGAGTVPAAMRGLLGIAGRSVTATGEGRPGLWVERKRRQEPDPEWPRPFWSGAHVRPTRSYPPITALPLRAWMTIALSMTRRSL
jgi:hypothetical protein